MTTKKLHIYGCGGAGINIVSGVPQDKQNGTDQTAETIISYIDTSRSNIKDNKINDGQLYLLPEMDGSGKKRDENHEEIAKLIKDIMVKHKPSDFNVVVFSLSGGSGSVIGPLLIMEMLNRDIPVVAICIGTDESVLTANNTLKTLKSLDSISKNTRKPVVMIYTHNDRGIVRSTIDRKVVSYIAGLTYLVSGNNEGLDSQDLINWLDFTQTTQLGPQIALLEVYSDATHVKMNHNIPVSIASLYSNKDNEGLSVVPDYQCDGITDLSEAKVDQLHFVIDVEQVPAIARRVEDTLRQQKEVAESRSSASSIVTSKDQVSSTGLVL